MADLIDLATEVRTEFGKGASRRARRDFKIPAVMYGHGTDPVHLLLPALDFAAVLRNHGTNAILALDINGKKNLALAKEVIVHPLRPVIQHVDLLVVRKGEKVSVDIPIVVEGDAAPDTLVTQDANTIAVLADVLNIPEQFTVSVEGLEGGTQILASDLDLPEGVELDIDADTLIVNITVEQETDLGEEDEDAEGDDAASAGGDDSSEE
ncbi:50S ribosomal protein L25/general stress protein Ctc [Hoyosella rhizosphaerae]|uniref:Large ribosomal subunit protein bL25 n=1 Tax=Hoyosella rhizosphaerae TaxID=1755582 RepID=A0A916UCB8_9ACTN|nr:50S ribosomal protein L25/general stress protein Ctc [Hoyosella rhizosphaerae]MBN4925728.1 50S ribosomal protein L25/general stress protein Ctc [Hoyosella rhizosphaerae]GGC68414.1 50S ribosomal protein L25 [Hoyosella rhizosphaerae]